MLVAVTASTCIRFSNGFVWDDVPLFVESDFIFNLRNAPALFTHDTMYSADQGRFASVARLDTYRPLTMLTFMLDGAWGEKRPLPFHVTGLALHLGVVALIWVFGRRWLEGAARDIAWFPALLFGIHPLFVEAHVWINGRSDSLATLLVVAAMVVGLPQSHREWPYPVGPLRASVAGVLFLGAMLSKEVALMALPLIALWRAGFWSHTPKVPLWTACRDCAPFGLAAIGYLGLRWAALGGVKAAAGAEHVGLALSRAGYYVIDGLMRILAPSDTAVRYIDEEYRALSWFVLLLGWIACLCLGAVFLLRRKQQPFLSFGFFWFAITLAPASLVAGAGWYGFGRYTYLPATMLFLGLTQGLHDFAQWHPLSHFVERFVKAGVALLMLTLFVLTMRATIDWKSSESFYLAILRDYPQASHGYGGLGRIRVEQARLDDALVLLKKAVELAPEDDRYLNNLAQAELRAGLLPEARRTAREGMRRFPGLAKFLHALAATYIHDDPRRSVRELVNALRLEPDNAACYTLLCQLVTIHPQREALFRQVNDLTSLPENAAIAPKISTWLATVRESGCRVESL
ncbi:MAG: hypothetical protein MUC50_23260 [Myxococcota bacterium]|nr:hypothetical protein [Myxococcota bacterium]